MKNRLFLQILLWILAVVLPGHAQQNGPNTLSGNSPAWPPVWKAGQAVGGPETYVGKEVFSLPWGLGPGQVPTHQEKITLDSGAGPSAVSLSNTYCLAALFVEKDGSIHIFSDSSGKNAFRKMSKTGQVLSESGDLGKECDLFELAVNGFLDEKGELEVFNADRQTFFKIRIADGSVLRHPVMKTTDSEYKKAYDHFRTSEEDEGLQRKRGPHGFLPMGKFSFLNPDTGKTLFEISGSQEGIPDGFLNWVKVFAVDKNKNFYVIGEIDDGDGLKFGPVYLIYKYSSDGKLLAKIDSLPDSYFKMGTEYSWVLGSSLGFRIGVDGDGNIYQLTGTSKGLELYEWVSE